MKALIIGGGIGGLTSGLFLHKCGIDFEIFEQSPRIQELGVGINLLPHAVKELAGLGLLDELKKIGIETTRLTYANHYGQTIWSEPRGIAAGLNFPQFSIHRGKLQSVLYRAVLDRGGKVNTGVRFDDFDQDDSSVTARFINNPDTNQTEISTRTGEILIAADGIHSTLRAKHFPNELPPRWDGSILWRGALEMAPWKSGREMLVAGTLDSKLIFYPISNDVSAPGKQLLNWAIGFQRGEENSPLPEREDWNRKGKRDELLDLVEAAEFRLGDIDPASLVAETEEIFEYPRCDRDPIERWSFGRTTLLGDAAHPMKAVGSNGASQAILDARALSDCLVASTNVQQALQNYQDRRLPLTTKIVANNLTGGPERVLDLIANRAPRGFDNIHDIASNEELRTIVQGYSNLAGFEKSQINNE